MYGWLLMSACMCCLVCLSVVLMRLYVCCRLFLCVCMICVCVCMCWHVLYGVVYGCVSLRKVFVRVCFCVFVVCKVFACMVCCFKTSCVYG